MNIFDSVSQYFGGVQQAANARIASDTQKTTNPSGDLVVINAEIFPSAAGFCGPANFTSPILCGKHSSVVVRGEPILCSEVGLPVVSGIFATPNSRSLRCLASLAFGILFAATFDRRRMAYLALHAVTIGVACIAEKLVKRLHDSACRTVLHAKRSRIFAAGWRLPFPTDRRARATALLSAVSPRFVATEFLDCLRLGAVDAGFIHAGTPCYGTQHTRGG